MYEWVEVNRNIFHEHDSISICIKRCSLRKIIILRFKRLLMF